MSTGGQRNKKPLLIAVGAIIAVLLIVYVGGVMFFSSHFFPNTTLGGSDVSLKSGDEVASSVQQVGDSYTLTVTGDGLNFTITAAQAGISLDGDSIASQALAANNAWAWPFELVGSHDAGQSLAATYNSAGLDTLVRQQVETFNGTATAPVNATIAYDDSSKKFAVQQEQAGTQVNADTVIAAVDSALVSLETKVTIGSDALLQPTVLSTDSRLASATQEANTYLSADLKLMLTDTVSAGEVGPAQISQWVTLDEDYTPSFDQDAMEAWVEDLADSLNTVGSTRTYTRPDGKVITVSGGAYGWEIDQEGLIEQVEEGIKAGTVGTISVPCTKEAVQYNGAGTQDWGDRYVDVDLAEQVVRMYDGGQLVFETSCISGIPDGEHDTPEGVFYITAKASPSKLVGYSNGEKLYESTVQYWMPFDGNAIGLHDATWQPGFGGTMYADGYGSHGCVNLSYDAAQELYSLVNNGDPVISHW